MKTPDEIKKGLECKRHFEVVICTKAGKGYRIGHIYALVGWNNGVHVIGCSDNGDPIDLVCHTWDNITHYCDDDEMVPQFKPYYEGMVFERLTQLESRLAQAERERDAAVRDLRMAFRKCNVCCCCKFDDGESNDCMDCIGSCNWQWRGVCAENTEEGN